jgi:hypothetical protein
LERLDGLIGIIDPQPEMTAVIGEAEDPESAVPAHAPMS